MRQREPRLDKLKAAIDKARAEQRRPLEPGEESRPLYPLQAYLDEAGMREVWKVVGALRERERPLANRFLGEVSLGDLIIDLVGDLDHVPTWRELCELLEQTADAQREWIVAIPLANLIPPSGYVELASRARLGLADQNRNWTRSGPDPIDPFAISRFGDRLSISPRWSPEPDGSRIDTRRTAALFLVEEGTREVALNVARTRARYALAVWCLLRPPPWQELWPTLAEWVPRPFLHGAIDHKQYEAGQRMPKNRVLGRTVSEYGPYELPADDELLRAPFAALALVEQRRSARALLSATHSLYLADREPNDLERTDRLLHIYAAIEALCDPGQTPTQPPSLVARLWRWLRRSRPERDNRWGRVTERYDVWKQLRASYSQREIRDAQRLARDLRNLAAHSAHAVLANLGFTATATRALGGARVVTGEELGLARAATALPVVRSAVHETATRLWRGALENGFDDVWWDAQFAAPRN
jgi:hypothetical protein